MPPTQPSRVQAAYKNLFSPFTLLFCPAKLIDTEPISRSESEISPPPIVPNGFLSKQQPQLMEHLSTVSQSSYILQLTASLVKPTRPIMEATESRSKTGNSPIASRSITDDNQQGRSLLNHGY
jgi:hypothetical protein